MPPVKAFCIIFILISELSHKASVLGIGPWCPWNVLPRFTKKHVNCQRLWTSWHYRGILNLISQNYLKYNLVFCYIYPKAKWKCGYIVYCIPSPLYLGLSARRQLRAPAQPWAPDNTEAVLEGGCHRPRPHQYSNDSQLTSQNPAWFKDIQDLLASFSTDLINLASKTVNLSWVLRVGPDLSEHYHPSQDPRARLLDLPVAAWLTLTCRKWCL